MLRYVIARLVGIVGVLLAVSIITFLMMHAVPGGPFDATESQQVPVPQSVRDTLAHKYQLDQPLYRQYLSYIGNVLHGDLGVSFKFGEPVTQFLARSWPVTIQLGAMTFVLSMVVGVVLGTISALRPNSIVDYVTSITVVTFIVMPTFVVAVLMIILFAVELKWLPTGGWGSPREAIMPVIAYALGPTATVARYTRASLLDALRADYVRTAKAKGLRQRAIVLRHAFKNALIPMLTVIGPLFAWMVTGSFFIETIFRVPGIGNELTLSIYNRDYPVIMALSLVWCTVIALAYLATDLLYAVADPRVRLSGGQS